MPAAICKNIIAPPNNIQIIIMSDTACIFLRSSQNTETTYGH